MRNPLKKLLPTKNEIAESALDNLGVSVYHLIHFFLAKEIVGTADLSRDSKIYEIENLKGAPGVIRKKGADVDCRLDGEKGAAYVHCLEGADHVGDATHMLSYSWGYSIGDIVDILSDFCQSNELNPKRTYVWICCLCVNQHRVALQKFHEKSGTVTTNSNNVDFFTLFGERVKRIGHLLAMMAPWKAPVYLTRVWCIYEIYISHKSVDCVVDIVMPRKEKLSLEQDVINEDKGVDALYEVLSNTKVQNAKASVDSDRERILAIVASTVGFQVLNHQVNDLLRGWMKQVLAELVVSRENTGDEAYALFCSKIGNVLGRNGDYDGALELHRKCLTIKETSFGKDHQETAGSYGDIGRVLSEKGDYDGALKQYKKCLDIEETSLGMHHPSTAATYGCIGGVLFEKGDYDGALEQHRKCLAIRETALGKDHSETAATYGNIGIVLSEKGDYDGALKQYKKCMAIQETAVGKDHPDTARTHSYIGLVLFDQGDYDGALKQYNKCLAIRETALGKDHPETAAIYGYVGSVLSEKGDCAGALEQHKKCLEIEETALGTDHPSTATTYSSIGLVLFKKGDYDGALEHHNKCMAIRETALGKDHSETAATYGNIGSVLCKMGEYNDALREFKKAFAIMNSVFGRNHSKTQGSWNSIVFVKSKIEEESSITTNKHDGKG